MFLYLYYKLILLCEITQQLLKIAFEIWNLCGYQGRIIEAAPNSIPVLKGKTEPDYTDIGQQVNVWGNVNLLIYFQFNYTISAQKCFCVQHVCLFFAQGGKIKIHLHKKWKCCVLTMHLFRLKH